MTGIAATLENPALWISLGACAVGAAGWIFARRWLTRNEKMPREQVPALVSEAGGNHMAGDHLEALPDTPRDLVQSGKNKSGSDAVAARLAQGDRALLDKIEALVNQGTSFIAQSKSIVGTALFVGRAAGSYAVVMPIPLAPRQSETIASAQALQAKVIVDALSAQTTLPLAVNAGDLAWETPAFTALDQADASTEIRDASSASASIRYGVDVAPQREAEAKLQQFIGTLSQIFAQLPTGLAIFDAQDQLTSFNPSFTDMMSLDVVWLAGRPGLREVFAALRDQKIAPAQKSVMEWRRALKTLIAQARDGRHTHHWLSGDGRNIRVTGQPHPNGAVAFLFEDLTTHVQLERKYRGQIDGLRAVLAQLSIACAIFDPAGRITQANTQGENRAISTLEDLIKIGHKTTAPWNKLREFVTGGAARANVQLDMTIAGEGAFQMGLAALPDGGTLLTFDQIVAKPSEARAPKAQTTSCAVPIEWPDPIPNPSMCEAIRVLAHALGGADAPEPLRAVRVDVQSGGFDLCAAPQLPSSFARDDSMAFRVFARVAASHGFEAHLIGERIALREPQAQTLSATG